MAPDGFILKSFSQRRDTSIFGSYIHPMIKAPTTSYYGEQACHINYNCYRVADFESTHFLAISDVLEYVYENPEASYLKDLFLAYTDMVYTLIRCGFQKQHYTMASSLHLNSGTIQGGRKHEAFICNFEEGEENALMHHLTPESMPS